MSINILSSGTTKLPADWTDASYTAIVASGRVDATASPGDGAKLTVISVLSSPTVSVPPGAQIDLRGWSFLGSRKLAPMPVGDGPRIEIKAITFFGSIKIKPA